ncbi:MAG: hypothetical protein R2939_08340 [Kofleriaceae bacterium]
MLEELGVATVAIEDEGVVVVGLEDGEEDVDAEAAGGLGQAVDDVVVGLGVGPEDVLALGAAPGDEVEAGGEDLTRERHGVGREHGAGQAPAHVQVGDHTRGGVRATVTLWP